MAKYRYVNCEYWTDVDILNFSPDEKLFYIYLLTNSHTKQCGIYEISIKHMEFETGYTGEVIKSLLHRFEKIYKKIKYNYITKELAIKTWAKYHTSTSPKVIKCINEELKNIKDLSLIAYVLGNDNPCNKEMEEPPKPQYEKDDSVKTTSENPFTVVCEVFEREIHPITSAIAERLRFYLKRMNPEVIVEAIKEASIRNKPSMKYIDTVLISLLKSAVTTVKNLDEYRASYKLNKASKEKEDDSCDTRDSKPSSYDELILSG